VPAVVLCDVPMGAVYAADMSNDRGLRSLTEVERGALRATLSLGFEGVVELREQAQSVQPGGRASAAVAPSGWTLIPRRPGQMSSLDVN
jgi:hypothetical protein